jgi:murein DD-endopeptidase MepM/ murein hydrolase activator NlpD
LKRRVAIVSIILSVIILAAGGLVTFSRATASPDRAGPVSISLEFEWIRQGRVGVVRVTGENLAEVRAVFQERVFHFYPASDGRGFLGLISAFMFGDIGTYPMQVWVQYADGSSERVDQDISVTHGEFGRVDLTLPVSMQPLLQPEVEAAELERLLTVTERFTPERYWADSGFIAPTTAPEIGAFGAWRLYNGTYWTRHTGIDSRMQPNTPVQAMANGRVVLSEMLTLRGGYVLIDHGWGIYSGYAHLGERLVVPGQWVRQGDVIALSGQNGRSTGPHLHWEMTVGGAWIDPEDLLALGLEDK